MYFTCITRYWSGDFVYRDQNRRLARLITSVLTRWLLRGLQLDKDNLVYFFYFSHDLCLKWQKIWINIIVLFRALILKILILLTLALSLLCRLLNLLLFLFVSLDCCCYCCFLLIVLLLLLFFIFQLCISSYYLLPFFFR